jgi:acetyl esterase/lipase
LENQLGFRPAVDLNGTLDDNRKVLEDGCALRDSLILTQDLKTGVTARDEVIKVTITGQKTEQQIPIRIYHSNSSTGRSVPAAVFFHGGGWILGSIAADDLFCRKLALDLNHVVVSVEYRLGKTHFLTYTYIATS